jgi:hypothetical protein
MMKIVDQLEVRRSMMDRLRGGKQDRFKSTCTIALEDVWKRKLVRDPL